MKETKEKLIYGIGINDAGYMVKVEEELPKFNGKRKRRVLWKYPYYTKWSEMLRRCYSETNLIKNPTYKDCTVCNEWHLFSNFKSWMETQDWEEKDLDKDLLLYKNKIYSPDTCCFISSSINKFLTRSDKSRGEHPIGVSCQKIFVEEKLPKPFKAQISISSSRGYLGCFASPEEAHRVWQKAKAALAFDLSLEQTDERVKQGLIRVYEKILSDYEQGLETIDF